MNEHFRKRMSAAQSSRLECISHFAENLLATVQIIDSDTSSAVHRTFPGPALQLCNRTCFSTDAENFQDNKPWIEASEESHGSFFPSKLLALPSLYKYAVYGHANRFFTPT
jgi:hypothetical protein